MERDAPDEHAAVLALLPWYQAGTLTTEEQQRVAAHLGSCGACNEELAACEALARAVRLADPLQPAAEAALARLHRRLPVAPRAPRRPPGWRGPAWLWPAWRWPALGGVAVAASLALGLALGTLPAEFRTVTDTPSARPAALPVLAAPGVTEAAFRGRLLALGLRVVDGPDAAGWYRVAPTDGSVWSSPALAGLVAAPELRFAP